MGPRINTMTWNLRRFEIRYESTRISPGWRWLLRRLCAREGKKRSLEVRFTVVFFNFFLIELFNSCCSILSSIMFQLDMHSVFQQYMTAVTVTVTLACAKVGITRTAWR